MNPLHPPPPPFAFCFILVYLASSMDRFSLRMRCSLQNVSLEGAKDHVKVKSLGLSINCKTRAPSNSSF